MRARLITPQFAIVTAAGALYFLSLGVTLPVIPRYIEDSLHGGSVAVGVGVGAFAVGAVVVRPFAGRLGDRLGRRILVVVGASIVGVASLLYVVADTLPLLCAARVLGGLGEAGFFVGAGTMIADLAPADRRGEAISYWSVAVYGGLAFGPAIGEAVLSASSFHTVWIVAAGLAFAASLLALAAKDTLSAEARAVAVARDEKMPLMNRSGLIPGLVLFLGLCALAGFVAFVPLYVEDVGLDNSQWIFLLYGCLILGVRIFGARLPDKLGSLRSGTAALVLGAVGMTLLAAWSSVAGLVAGTIVFSLGMSQMYPSMLTFALTDIDETERASVVGTVSTFFDLSQGLGALILGGAAALAGYRGAFLAGGLLAVGGLVLLWSGFDPRVRRRGVDAHAFEEIPEPEPGT